MNDEFRRQVLQQQVKGKFRGKQTLPSRTKPIYPDGAERELQRVSWAYLVNEVVKKYMPAIRKAAAAERERNRRQDDAGDLMLAIQKAFRSMSEELERKTDGFGLRKKLEDLANLTRKLSRRPWASTSWTTTTWGSSTDSRSRPGLMRTWRSSSRYQKTHYRRCRG